MKAKKILLVDDEPDFIQPILECLELEFGSSVQIYYFQSIDETMLFIKKEGLDNIFGVILDIMLDFTENASRQIIEGGFDIAKTIRKLNATIPIIFFSLISEYDPMVKKCLAIENTSFISKTDPESIEKLTEFISLR